jgi:hypothetical protein
MGYEHLFGERDVALLYDWLQETGELYMNLDRPHSGGDNGSVYFIHSLAQIRRIVAEEKHPEISITIFREKQYPIRGTADETLLASALDFIPDGEWFSIVSPGDGPFAPCTLVGFGDTHSELREHLIRLRNKSVYFGRNPFDRRDSYFETPEDAWVANSYQHPPQITKNRILYASFEAEPDRYRSHIASW